MRAVTLIAGLLIAAGTVSPAFAAKSKTINRTGPSWSQCFQISLDRGMDHEYEEWREFLEDCVAGKIPLDKPAATRWPKGDLGVPEPNLH